MQKLTIITPSFNLGATLERTILSVLEQPYDAVEYFVMDGGSTDNTRALLKKYEKKRWGKKRFAWISEPDKGQTNAINKGLARATGDWFAWINADDYYEDGAFAVLTRHLDENRDAGLVYGNCLTHFPDHVDANIPPARIPYRTFAIGNPIYGPSAFFNTNALRFVGDFNESLHYWMDYEMFVRIARFFRLHYVNELLAHFTIREGQKSRDEESFIPMLKEERFIKRVYCRSRLFNYSIDYIPYQYRKMLLPPTRVNND